MLDIREFDCVLFKDGTEGVLLENFDGMFGLFDMPIPNEAPDHTEPEVRAFKDIEKVIYRNK